MKLRNKIITTLAALLGLAALCNGLFMTFWPEHWYWLVPGVPNRGPFNQHFVRDIGLNYMLIGVAYTAGCFFLKQRVALWLMPTAWLTSHAMIHVWEVMTGICDIASLIQDVPGVIAPAILAISLTYAGYRYPAA